jgi:hypothetical protein
MTTVLPMARAGPTLPAILVRGKLYGVMQADTPTGCRAAMAPSNIPGASCDAIDSLGGNGSSHSPKAKSAYSYSRLAQPGTWAPAATARVAPVSAWTSGTSSSCRSTQRSAAARSKAERSLRLVSDQESKACLAAAAAAATSSTVASGARPTTSSVAGLMIS